MTKPIVPIWRPGIPIYPCSFWWHLSLEKASIAHMEYNVRLHIVATFHYLLYYPHIYSPFCIQIHPTDLFPSKDYNIVPYLSLNEWSRGGLVLILTLWSSKVATANSHSIWSCKAHEQIPISFWIAKLIEKSQVAKSHSILNFKTHGQFQFYSELITLWGSPLKIGAHFIHSIHSHLTSSFYCRKYYYSILLISPLQIKPSSLFNPQVLT